MSGPRYRVAFRRRRINLTDYQMRKSMILSGKLRLIVRLSSKYLYIQLAEPSELGDNVLAFVCSKELGKFGWKASSCNTSAAYLSGLLIGKRALDLGIKEAILDIGLRRPSIGARVFAVLKGVTDVGLSVPYNEKILPSDERIAGEHIASYAKKLLEEDQQKYGRIFSYHLSQGLKPESLPDHFRIVKNNIIKGE